MSKIFQWRTFIVVSVLTVSGASAANAESAGSPPQIGMYFPFNWLLNVATAVPDVGTQNSRYVALGGEFYPNPAPTYWQNPPAFSDYTNFGAATTVVATKSGESPVFPNYAASKAEPFSYYTQIPYSPGAVGVWNLNVTTKASPASGLPAYAPGNFTTQDTTGAPFLNPASSISVSNQSPDATLNWSFGAQPAVPPGSSLRVNIGIQDSSGTELFFDTFPYATTSLDLGALPPNENPGALPPPTLVAGNRYTFNIYAALFGGADGSQISESLKSFVFEPSDSSNAQNVYLPDVVIAGGVATYAFDMSVAAGQDYNIDPALAHGFVYKIGAGDPNFASVELPNIGGLNDYSLYLWENGGWVFDTSLAPDTLFRFGTGGVSEFEVLGINPAVDASSGNEFVTQVSFVGNGSFTGSMTAVVPEASTWMMMALGFTGLGVAGYRVSRRTAAATA